MDNKYSKDTEGIDSNVNFSFLESKSVRGVKATVEEIRLSDKTRPRINENGETSMRCPVAMVRFSTEKTDFTKPYSLDPYLDDSDRFKPYDDISTLVSTCEVGWDELDEIISSKVDVCSPSEKSTMELENPRDPRSYMVLADCDPYSIKCESIEYKMVQSLVNLVKNMHHGRAKVESLEVVEDNANVKFELYSGHNFTQSFTLKNEESEPTKIQIYSPFHEYNTTYTFWDLCRDTIGYVPAQSSEYSRMIGESIDIQYDRGSWKVLKPTTDRTNKIISDYK